MKLKYVLKHYKNKILATSLSGLALGIYLAYHIIMAVSLGAAYFDFRTIWNAVLTIIAYAIIFFCNIRNDNFAYTGILMFVFFVTFDHIYSIFVSNFSIPQIFADGDGALVTTFLLTMAGNVALVVSGILLYIWVRRYMVGLMADFRKIRLFGIAFAGILFISVAVEVTFMILAGIFVPGMLWTMFAVPVSEVVMALAIIFTLERLRRI